MYAVAAFLGVWLVMEELAGLDVDTEHDEQRVR